MNRAPVFVKGDRVVRYDNADATATVHEDEQEGYVKVQYDLDDGSVSRPMLQFASKFRNARS